MRASSDRRLHARRGVLVRRRVYHLAVVRVARAPRVFPREGRETRVRDEKRATTRRAGKRRHEIEIQIDVRVLVLLRDAQQRHGHDVRVARRGRGRDGRGRDAVRRSAHRRRRRARRGGPHVEPRHLVGTFVGRHRVGTLRGSRRRDEAHLRPRPREVLGGYRRARAIARRQLVPASRRAELRAKFHPRRTVAFLVGTRAIFRRAKRRGDDARGESGRVSREFDVVSIAPRRRRRAQRRGGCGGDDAVDDGVEREDVGGIDARRRAVVSARRARAGESRGRGDERRESRGGIGR